MHFIILPVEGCSANSRKLVFFKSFSQRSFFKFYKRKIIPKKEEIRRKIKTKKRHTVLFYLYFTLTCKTKHTPSLLAVCACVWDFCSSSGNVLRISYAS